MVDTQIYKKSIVRNGGRAYKTDNYFHRVGQPSYLGSFAKSFYSYGVAHNLWGPAKIYGDGTVAYYINGHHVDKRFWEKCQETVCNKPLVKDNKCIGIKWSFTFDGIEYLHRTDGPAITVIDDNGTVLREEYWLAGQQVNSKERFYELVAKKDLVQEWYEERADDLPNPCWVTQTEHAVYFCRDEDAEDIICKLSINIDRDTITEECWFSEGGAKFNREGDKPAIIYYNFHNMERAKQGVQAYQGKWIKLDDGRDFYPAEFEFVDEWNFQHYPEAKWFNPYRTQSHIKYTFANGSYIRVFSDGTHACFDSAHRLHSDSPTIPAVYSGGKAYYYNRGNAQEQTHVFEDGLEVKYYFKETEGKGDLLRLRDKDANLITVCYQTEGLRYWTLGPKKWQGLENYKKKTYCAVGKEDEPLTKTEFYNKFVHPTAKVSGYQEGPDQEDTYVCSDGLNIKFTRKETNYDTVDGNKFAFYRLYYDKRMICADYPERKRRYWRHVNDTIWTGCENYGDRIYDIGIGRGFGQNYKTNKKQFYEKIVFPVAHVTGYTFEEEQKSHIQMARDEIQEEEDKEFIKILKPSSQINEGFVVVNKPATDEDLEPNRYVLNDGLVVGYSTCNETSDVELFDKNQKLILSTSQGQKNKNWYRDGIRVGAEYTNDKAEYTNDKDDLYFPGQLGSSKAISKEEFYRDVVVPNLRTGATKAENNNIVSKDSCGPMNVIVFPDGLKHWYGKVEIEGDSREYFDQYGHRILTVHHLEDSSVVERLWYNKGYSGWVGKETIKDNEVKYYHSTFEKIDQVSAEEFYRNVVCNVPHIANAEKVFLLPPLIEHTFKDGLHIEFATVNEEYSGDKRETICRYYDRNHNLFLKVHYFGNKATNKYLVGDRFWYKNDHCVGREVFYEDGVDYYIDGDKSVSFEFARKVISQFPNTKFKYWVDPDSKFETEPEPAIEFHTETVTTEEEDTHMSNTKEKPEVDVKAVIISDLKKGSYRFGQHKALALTKKSILAALQKDESIAEHTDAFAKVLDTPVGTAMLSLSMGLGLTYAPKICENEHVAAVAKEFRVDGMHKVGHEVADQVKKHVLPVLQKATTLLPKQEQNAPKIRVQTPEDVDVPTTEENSDPVMKSKASA